ncbi:unnamed protein product [Orchesella dallaii]|uniref:Galectin n=1 Tax=Orchesella dallaii TaxID=48710 RepID=A0ABP1S8D7_9HEXA
MITLCFLILAITASQSLFIAEPKIPFITHLGSGLVPGNKISITGLILPGAYNFAINLRNGFNRDPNGGIIVFHFNPRFFSPNYLVLNTHLDGVGWLSEQRLTERFPFQKQFPFLLEILCEQDRFLVSVDGQPVSEYQYRVPLAQADVLEIYGDGEVDIYLIDVTQPEKLQE